MKTRFKTSPKNKKSKLIKWFGVYWWKVNNLKEYYKLKYPNLFPVQKKVEFLKKYINKSNFRNSQNYVVWDYMKYKLENTKPQSNFYYFLLIFTLISIWIIMWETLFLTFLVSTIIIIIISLILEYYNKFNNFKEKIVYKKLWKKYKSDNLFFRIRIKKRISIDNFIIIKNNENKI